MFPRTRQRWPPVDARNSNLSLPDSINLLFSTRRAELSERRFLTCHAARLPTPLEYPDAGHPGTETRECTMITRVPMTERTVVRACSSCARAPESPSTEVPRRSEPTRPGSPARTASLYNFIFVPPLTAAEGNCEKPGTIVVRADNLLYFVAPVRPRVARQAGEGPGEESGEEEEEVGEEGKKGNDSREENPGNRKDEGRGKTCEAVPLIDSPSPLPRRTGLSGSAVDDLLLCRNLLVFCPTY